MHQIHFSNFVAAASNHRPSQEIIFINHRVQRADSDYFQNLAPEKIAEIRRATWDIFHKVVTNNFSTPILNRANRDYDFESKWEYRNSPNPEPFVGRYVEVFGLAAANIHVEDLSLKIGKDSICHLSIRQIRELMSENNADHYIGPLDPPIELGAGPKHTYQYFIHDPFPLDKRRLNLYEGLENLNHHPHAYMQRLSMAIINHIKGGEIIPAPSSMGIDYYQALQPISGEGLYAVPLIPASAQSNLPRLLLFRQTQMAVSAVDGIDTWLNNLQEHNGERGYLACQQRLNELMESEEFRGKAKERIIVSAYSLGNTHAGYFIRDHFDKIREAILFNGVSNSDERVVEEAAERINAMDPDDFPPFFFIYRNATSSDGRKGDFAQFLGKKHIGWGINHPYGLVQVMRAHIPWPTPGNFEEWGRLHSFRFLEDSHYQTKFAITVIRGEELDIELDNTKRGKEVSFFEEMRQKVGVKFLYGFINFIYVALKFIFRLFNINLLRTSR